jgi:threonylcarbamoyladenosine tRNA methylthiotransferase MtaB
MYNMKYRIITLGCKVNQYETQAMETLLAELGHLPASEWEPADVVIVNTCAVTAESGRKSRQAVRRARAENPGALLAVCGCFSQVSPEDAAALDADIIYGSGERAELVEEIQRRMTAPAQPETPVLHVTDPTSRREIELLPAGAVAGRARAYLKIQDGCDNFCSYCIIPYARGRVRSLPAAQAAEQAAQLEERGYRELVLTGIEIASYGKDLPGDETLVDLVETVAQAAPHMRLRLGSLEPRVVTAEFCRRLAALGRVCRHFHLSLQSGCDTTLRQMRRRYDTARFYESVELLRAAFPGCAITADLIVGFPGETEEDHAATLAFIRKCAFSSMHIFPYSVRPGTRAASLPGQLDRPVKTRRAHEAKAVADGLERTFLNSCVGQVLPVLFETISDGVSIGHGDNYCEVSVNGIQSRGVVRNVQISAVSGQMLVGEVV